MEETFDERLERCKTFANADDIYWLIEQAEKVEKLQSQVNAKVMFASNGNEEEMYMLQASLEKIAHHVSVPLGEKEDYRKTVYEFICIAKQALGY